MAAARTTALVTGVCLALVLASDAGQPGVDTLMRGVISSRPDLVELYGEPVAPLWTDASGVPTRSAHDALRLLEYASTDGLNPDDYHVDRLRALLRQLEQSSSADAAARFDLWMSDAVLAYMRTLQHGRVDPRRLGVTLTSASSSRDNELAARVHAAARDGQMVALAQAVRPRTPQYAALQWALARYRAAAATDTPVVLPFTATVHPGERYAALDLLRARLAVLGDLGSDESLSRTDVYDGAVVDAVVRFQRRHGLDADGVLGAKTIAQLSTPLARRVRQIELALERLRWLPREATQRSVLVNIPSFTVSAWDGAPASGTAAFTSPVIVGRAGRTETPVFDAVMTDILFRPYWNVPRTIVRNEIMPAIRRQPDYLQRERMELVDGDGDASPVVDATPANLARLAQGRLRVRQRPGPTNALGLIKFLFPNPHDVYMHATPAPALFARTRRDFSHGCVRVQDPVGLAEWVLAGQDGWNRARIVSAMEAAGASRLAVVRPVRVVLFYSTAEVDLSSGDVVFLDDLYARDDALDRVMREPVLPLPEPDTAGVDVHEIGRTVEAHAAAARGERRFP